MVKDDLHKKTQEIGIVTFMFSSFCVHLHRGVQHRKCHRLASSQFVVQGANWNRRQDSQNVPLIAWLEKRQQTDPRTHGWPMSILFRQLYHLWFAAVSMAWAHETEDTNQSSWSDSHVCKAHLSDFPGSLCRYHAEFIAFTNRLKAQHVDWPDIGTNWHPGLNHLQSRWSTGWGDRDDLIQPGVVREIWRQPSVIDLF